MQGLLLVGECLGCKSEQKSFKDKVTGENKVFNDVVLGVKIPKHNGFDGDTETVIVNLSKTQIDAKLHDLLDDLKGKILTFSVSQEAWSTAKSSGIRTRLSGDGKPLED